jgi:dihydroorotate dehydrogenase
LISAGGIDSADEAKRRLDAGAVLVQVYSALVYKGPGLIRDILSGIR